VGWTWNLDTNWSISSTAVTGSLRATINTSIFPSCPPTVNYTVSGTIALTQGTDTGTSTTKGTTVPDITASNPDQQSRPGCIIAQQIRYYGGTGILNSGCNTGNGNWVNDLSNSGTYSWTKPCDVSPDGNPADKSFGADWALNDSYMANTGLASEPVYEWIGQIQANRDFSGREVVEQDPYNGPSDTCNWSGSAITPPTLSAGWFVGALGAATNPGMYSKFNQYGYDLVGWSGATIRTIRQDGPMHGITFPCSTIYTQDMYLLCPQGQGYDTKYQRNTLKFGIQDANTIFSSRTYQSDPNPPMATLNWQ
jgi:hypothetical protein